MSWSTPASPGGQGLSDLWRSDIRPTLTLGLPIAGAQVAQMAINTTDVLMIGWLGATELAAVVLAYNLFILIWLFGMGVLQAVIPLAATARGDRRPRDVRRAVRMGIWFAVLYTIPSWCVLWFTEDIMLAFGQDPEVSALAGDYMQVMMFSVLPSLLVMALRNFITVMEKAQVVLWATVLAALMNAGIDYLLIFGHFGFPRLEVVGAGIASVATATLTVVLLVIYTLWQRQLRRYAILGRIWRSDWPKMLEILRLGWPVAVTLLVEVALFSGASVMMGWIGTLPLAAHGIATQLAAITFMVPLGLGQAGMIRVGLAAGHKDRAAVGRAGWVALFGSMLFMLCGAIVFWSFPETLVRLFLDLNNPQAEEVLAIGITFLLVAAVFQLFDGVQVVGGCVLRGLSDTRVPMVLAILGYWGVGMGLAYGLAFPGGFGGVGIWWGLAAGLASVSVALMWRFAWRERLGLL